MTKKPSTIEEKRFTSALRGILSVTREEIEEAEAREREEKKLRPVKGRKRGRKKRPPEAGK